MQKKPEVTAAIDVALESLAGGANCNVEGEMQRGIGVAGRQAVYRVLDDLVAIMFPGCHGEETIRANRLRGYLRRRLTGAAVALQHQIAKAVLYQCAVSRCRDCGDCEAIAERATARLLGALPRLQDIYQRDLLAAYEGDPAARSTMEIVMSYPGFYAIVVHRIAHLLYEEGVPLIPRILSERAHSLTGIDIHPGARIGGDFFIDHGTGVVVGETTVIGDRVKVYQGVTLGALSFSKDGQGKPIKGIKRHPDVEDDVTIYSGATILGGNTVIGRRSVIGANVWLTHSVPPDSTVYNQQPQPLIRSHEEQSE